MQFPERRRVAAAVVGIPQAVKAGGQAPGDPDLGGRDPLGDKPEGGLLERVEDELELLPIVHRQPAHPSADVRLEFDQAVRLELQEGFPDRRLRHIEPGDEVGLDQPRAGWQLELGDHLDERVVDRALVGLRPGQADPRVAGRWASRSDWYGRGSAHLSSMVRGIDGEGHEDVSHGPRGLANNRVSDTILQTLARFGRNGCETSRFRRWASR